MKVYATLVSSQTHKDSPSFIGEFSFGLKICFQKQVTAKPYKTFVSGERRIRGVDSVEPKVAACLHSVGIQRPSGSKEGGSAQRWPASHSHPVALG